nr:MFS transporter [Candidatus Kapabacteria bacterium]
MLAYWALLIQLPIYIAQKDMAGGLQWEQTTKGIIFFWWAIVQNLVPIFAGGFADRYGRKNFLLVSIVL